MDSDRNYYIANMFVYISSSTVWCNDIWNFIFLHRKRIFSCPAFWQCCNHFNFNCYWSFINDARNIKERCRVSEDAKFTVYGSQIQKWTDDIQMLVKQRDQYKEENEQLKTERESMVSDYQKKLDLISVLKEENKKLKDKLND